MVSVVQLQLPPNVPIVGCELVPYVLLKRADNSMSSFYITESNPIDGHFLRYKWYRIQSDKRPAVCSVHPTKQARLQCIECIRAKVPHAKSFHCSTECFSDAWHHHSVLHKRAASASNETGTSVSSSASTTPTAVIQRNASEVWVEVGCSKEYVPAADDVGHALKFECVVVDAENGLIVGPPSTLSTSLVIPAPSPVPRRIVPVVNLDPRTNIPPAERFSVLSYNILSDVHARDERYRYCPKWALSWPYRRQNLLREIVSYRADIVCLQEVQNDHFEEFFVPELDKHGYQACFIRKTAEGPYETIKNIDGCATFFRRGRFSLLSKHEIEFNKMVQSLTHEVAPSAWNVNALNRFTTDNVALVLFLQTKSNYQGIDNQGKRQLICVVHNLLKTLESIVGPAGTPVLLCGDLGSVPGSLLTSGKIGPLHPDLAVDPFGIHRPASKLMLKRPLVSAYTSFARLRGELNLHHKKKLDPTFGEPLFTDCSEQIFRTHDYIFYSADKLRLLSLLELLDESSIRKVTALPSVEWPSDHIALLAELWCPPMA